MESGPNWKISLCETGRLQTTTEFQNCYPDTQRQMLSPSQSVSGMIGSVREQQSLSKKHSNHQQYESPCIHTTTCQSSELTPSSVENESQVGGLHLVLSQSMNRLSGGKHLEEKSCKYFRHSNADNRFLLKPGCEIHNITSDTREDIECKLVDHQFKSQANVLKSLQVSSKPNRPPVAPKPSTRVTSKPLFPLYQTSTESLSLTERHKHHGSQFILSTTTVSSSPIKIDVKDKTNEVVSGNVECGPSLNLTGELSNILRDKKEDSDFKLVDHQFEECTSDFFKVSQPNVSKSVPASSGLKPWVAPKPSKKVISQFLLRSGQASTESLSLTERQEHHGGQCLLSTTTMSNLPTEWNIIDEISNSESSLVEDDPSLLQTEKASHSGYPHNDVISDIDVNLSQTDNSSEVTVQQSIANSDLSQCEIRTLSDLLPAASYTHPSGPNSSRNQSTEVVKTWQYKITLSNPKAPEASIHQSIHVINHGDIE